MINTTSPITSPSTFLSETSPQEPRKVLLKIIISIVLILIIGGQISLATRIWDPLWNPFRPEPEKIIEKMGKKMEGVKTLHSEGKIEARVREGEKEISALSMSFSGDSDNTDSKNPKSALSFKLAFKGEMGEFSVGGETKTIGKISYYKLTKLTFPEEKIPEEMGMINLVITFIKDKWFKVDADSILNWFREMAEKTDQPLPPEMEEQFKKQTQIQEEFLKKVGELLKGKKFFLAKKEFSDVKIQNQKTYHYLVFLNKEEIKKAIPELFKTLIETTESIQPTTEEWEKFQKEFPEEFDKFFQKTGDIEGEIWIGKKDNYLYKIKAEKEIDASQFEETAKEKITIKAEIDFSNLNQPMEIRAPEESVSIGEILDAMLGPFLEAMEGARFRARDARIIANMSQIRAMAEIFYNDNGTYSGVCADSDVKTIWTDITTQGGTNYLCAATAKKYCVKVQLNSGKWRCIDNSLKSKEYDTKPVCAIGRERCE